jgi:beta-galactosidase
VGIDEGILVHDLGRGSASFASTEFKIFIDGKPAASSPVMRIGVPPWRFDVEIPRGAKTISLVSGDAGDGNREDIANWVDAGFTLRK